MTTAGSDRLQHATLVLLAAAALCLAAVPAAPAATGPHVTLDLVAAAASIELGRPFWAGLDFRLEPGWHIYWANPGDSGEPPRIAWSLPPGFAAGPIRWPVPRRIPDHSLIDYGYEGEVLLPVEIKPPPGLEPGSEVRLSASVRWLVCRDICVPGRAQVDLSLRAGGAADVRAATPPLFARTLAALPRPAPAAWKVSARAHDRWLVLDVVTGTPESAAMFFPLDPNVIENAAPQKLSSRVDGVRLVLQKSDQLLKLPPHLTGVLVLSSGRGCTIDTALGQ